MPARSGGAGQCHALRRQHELVATSPAWRKTSANFPAKLLPKPLLGFDPLDAERELAAFGGGARGGAAFEYAEGAFERLRQAEGRRGMRRHTLRHDDRALPCERIVADVDQLLAEANRLPVHCRIPLRKRHVVGGFGAQGDACAKLDLFSGERRLVDDDRAREPGGGLLDVTGGLTDAVGEPRACRVA